MKNVNLIYVDTKSKKTNLWCEIDFYLRKHLNTFTTYLGEKIKQKLINVFGQKRDILGDKKT